jgi:hypothetical protein
MVPGLFGNNQLASNRLLPNIEDAKNDAAEFLLMQMYPQFLGDLNQPDQVYNIAAAPVNGATGADKQQANNTTSTTPTVLANSQTPNIISTPNDQNSLYNNSTVVETIPIHQSPISQTPILQAPYILDPSGQYLMYQQPPQWQ